MNKIEFEMVPENMWYCNLRHILSKSQWDNIRKASCLRANNKCVICGRNSKRLEAHELWDYNEETKIQSLKDIIALCPMCHKTIHIGFANVIGMLDRCLMHYCKVNKCTMDKCNEDYLIAVENWKRRSLIDWTLNLDWLKDNHKLLVDASKIKEGINIK